MGNGDGDDWRLSRPWAADGHTLYALPTQGRVTIGFLKSAAVAGHIADLHNAGLAAGYAQPAPPATPAPPPAPAEVPPPAPAGGGPRRPTPKEIRDWAQQRGYQLSGRGRIPAHIVEHYREVHGAGQ